MSRLFVLAAVLIAASFAARAQGNAGAGRAAAERQGCTGCHSIGENPGDRGAPYLAGQKIYYLTKQMTDLRLSQFPLPASTAQVRARFHPVMGDQSAPLSDGEIANIAEYLAGLPCVFRRFAVNRDLEPPAVAKRCAFCHGPNGNTPIDIVPNIAGQKKEYLTLQLHALRNSAHEIATSSATQRFHRMMAPMVFELTDADIAALANFYSSQSCRAPN